MKTYTAYVNLHIEQHSGKIAIYRNVEDYTVGEGDRFYILTLTDNRTVLVPIEQTIIEENK